MTTIIVINDERYGLEETINDAALGDLFTLKVKSTAMGMGVSVKTLVELFDRVNELRNVYNAGLEAWQKGPDTVEPPTSYALSMLEDEFILMNLVGLVFLSKRKAGEKCSFEDAASTSFNDISLENEDDDEPEGDVAPNPKDGTSQLADG